MLKFAKKIGHSLINIPYEENIFLQIKPFKDEEMKIHQRENFLKGIASLGEEKISFAFHGNKESIKIFVQIPKGFRTFFKNIFFANFPTADIVDLEENIWANEQGKENYQDTLRKIFQKQKHFVYQNNSGINATEDFSKSGNYMDPMKNILSLFYNIWEESELNIITTMFFKKTKGIAHWVLHVIKLLWGQSSEKLKEEAEKEKWKMHITFWYTLKSKDHYERKALEDNINSTFQTFWGKFRINGKEKFIGVEYNQAVNFFHLPLGNEYIKGMEYSVFKKLPYPTNLPTQKNSSKEELTLLGKTHYRGEDISFGIKKEDKFRHMYIVGKTGTGKSTFISNMVKSDIQNNQWVCLLDPHGDLIDTVLEHIPQHRINDVILFDVSDSDFPIGFNLLQAENEDEKNRIASGVVATFYKLFEHSWGPRLEYILRNVVLSIIDYPNATIMHILRVLIDKNFRIEVVSHIKDEVVKKFWTNEFDKRNDRQREEAIGPITNKIGQFLSSRVVRNIFGQPRTKLNIRKVMDEGKILLVNLSKGKIWEDNSTMIGSLLTTKIQIDAMSRADIPMHERKDFYLYIDEFQNFATKSFATILSEARKYKLSLIVANQFTAQLDEDIRDAIFGNVGTMMSFTLGKDDADIISGQYKNIVSANDLISLPMFTAYIKLMVDGINSDPFSMRTMPLTTPDGSLELIDKIRKQSRQRYAMEKKELEKLMDARSKKSFTIQEKIAEKAKLEGLGLNELEIKNLEDFTIQWNIGLFGKTGILDNQWNEEEADAMIFDIKNGKHKFIWHNKPQNIDACYRKVFSKGSSIEDKKNWKTLKIFCDIYHCVGKYQVWVGEKQDIFQQLEHAYWHNQMKYVPNIEKLEKDQLSKNRPPLDIDPSVPQSGTAPLQGEPISHLGGESLHKEKTSKIFSIKDIKIWKHYEWYVKLQYNYGMFVTVKGVEGLLHKSEIISPSPEIERKKYYNIWDKIIIKAKEIKEINWEQKVVWSQK